MQKLRPLFTLFFRSLRDETRSRLPTILRFAVVALLLLIVWANQRSFSDQTAPGREFLSYVMGVNLGVLAIAALSIFPSAIAEEKEDETLMLLRMTNLSPVAILFGKSTSRFAGAMLLLAVQIPFTLLAITLGGIAMRQVWGCYAILASWTFFLCNFALFASVICRTTLRAGFLSGAVGTLLYVVIPIAVFMWGRSAVFRYGTAVPTTFLDGILAHAIQTHPLFSIMVLIHGARGFMNMSLASHLQFNLVAGAVLFLLSWLLFDRFCTRHANLAPKPKKAPTDGKRRRLAWFIRPSPRLALIWKEFHFMVGGRRGFWIRLACAITVAALVCWEESASYFPSIESTGKQIVFYMGLCAGLDLLLIAGRIFGAERRLQTLSGLVLLPWTTGKLIRQKVLGCLPALLPWAVFAAIGAKLRWESLSRDLGLSRAYGYGYWEDADYIQRHIVTMAYFLSQAFMLVLLVAWLSLRMRRGALPAAVVGSIVLNIAVGICHDVIGYSNRLVFMQTLVGLTALAVMLLAFGVYRRLPAAAAEES